MTKLKEFRDLSTVELDVSLKDTRKELFNLINEWQRTKKLEKPHQLRTKRKEIAQLLTVMTEKQNEQPKAKAKSKKSPVKAAPRKSKAAPKQKD